jgi:hypothetical protein
MAAWPTVGDAREPADHRSKAFEQPGREEGILPIPGSADQLGDGLAASMLGVRPAIHVCRDKATGGGRVAANWLMKPWTTRCR